MEKIRQKSLKLLWHNVFEVGEDINISFLGKSFLICFETKKSPTADDDGGGVAQSGVGVKRQLEWGHQKVNQHFVVKNYFLPGSQGFNAAVL